MSVQLPEEAVTPFPHVLTLFSLIFYIILDFSLCCAQFCIKAAAVWLKPVSLPDHFKLSFDGK